MSSAVVWNRKRKGGARRVRPILVKVISQESGGYVWIERVRRGRVLREVVQVRHLEEITAGADG